MSATIVKPQRQVIEPNQKGTGYLGHAVWTGTIQFGLVSIPVKLYTTVSEHDLPLKMRCPVHPQPIHMKRWCETCKQDYSWDATDQAGRLAVISKGVFVPIENSELEAIKPKSSKTLDLSYFANAVDIDPLLFEKAYYALPDPKLGGQKAYALLLEAMKRKGKMAVGKLCMRSKESLSIIQPIGDTLVVRIASFPDELREARVPLIALDEQEINLASELIDTIASKMVDLSVFRDDYHESLSKLIEDKLANRQPVQIIEGVPVPQPSKSLMDALKASIAQKKPADQIQVKLA